jgi:hypothetical protein
VSARSRHSNVVPIRHKLPPLVISKGSETRREYMQQAFGKLRGIPEHPKGGKMFWFPDRVVAHLEAMTLGMEQQERRLQRQRKIMKARPYIYGYEVVYEMMRLVSELL